MEEFLISMDNSILKWVLSEVPDFPYTPDFWTKVVDVTTSPLSGWQSPTYNKILGHKLPADLDINKTTVLGGICSIYTAETECIRNKELTFKDIDDFERWIYSWYPRIDQIHDTVGIPPKLCKKIIYVCEDSLFAKRLAMHTGLHKDQLQRILKEVHVKQGHPVLCNWLKSFGYSGNIEVVYTSDLEKELRVGVKFWERLLGFHFQNRYQEFAKVELMHTAIWLDILGIKNFGVIYEPINHMSQPNNLKDWAINHKFGVGFNHNLGVIGYLPLWNANGLSRVLPLEQVPHYGNVDTYSISTDDLPWHVVNFLFANKEVLAANPTAISKEKAMYLIKSILNQCYSVYDTRENKNEKS